MRFCCAYSERSGGHTVWDVPPRETVSDEIGVFLFSQYDVTRWVNDPINFNDTAIIVKDLAEFLFHL